MKRVRRAAIILLLILAMLFLAAAGVLYLRGLKEKDALPQDSMKITVIDIGQGSATLIQSGGYNLLVDCGEASRGDDLCAALKTAGVKKLDTVIITHLHSDHFGGFVSLPESIKINGLIEPKTPRKLVPDTQLYNHFRDIITEYKIPVTVINKAATRVLANGVVLTFLDGFLKNADNLNNTSLCIRIDCKNVSLLITGDAESEIEQKLMESDLSAIDCDLLIAGHHGSSTSSRADFLNSVTPVASFISVSVDNDYNLPNEYTLRRLSAFGQIYRTDTNGTITILTDGDSAEIKATDIDDKIESELLAAG